MIRIFYRVALASALVFFLGTVKGIEAQERPEEDPVNNVPKKDMEDDNGDQALYSFEPTRDPFGLSERIRSKVPAKSGKVKRKSTEEPERFPAVVLRGYIRVKGRKPAALLEVDSRDIYLVREAEILTLQWQNSLTVLKVKKIGEQSVLIEIGASARIVTVR